MITMKHSIKTALFAVIASFVILSACAPVSTPADTLADPDTQVIIKDYGRVTQMAFVRHTKSAAYFHVTTDRVTWNELDITLYPDESVKIGDNLFEKTVLSKSLAQTYMCKNNLCQPYGICYSWMPCFNRYEQNTDNTTR